GARPPRLRPPGRTPRGTQHRDRPSTRPGGAAGRGGGARRRTVGAGGRAADPRLRDGLRSEHARPAGLTGRPHRCRRPGGQTTSHPVTTSWVTSTSAAIITSRNDQRDGVPRREITSPTAAITTTTTAVIHDRSDRAIVWAGPANAVAA